MISLSSDKWKRQVPSLPLGERAARSLIMWAYYSPLKYVPLVIQKRIQAATLTAEPEVECRRIHFIKDKRNVYEDPFVVVR